MNVFPPGTRIGQYEIASRPMRGGMGVVYFALDHGNDGRPVALKTFRPEFLPDRAARDRFLREGTSWVDLGNHPHIVRCYKVEYIDPTAFLVLELIAKEQDMPDASLRSWLIPGHPLPIEQALLFALQIARGMQHATGKIPGFVHRDLKPENILVGADKLSDTNINRLRVTDFGLIKTIADSSVLPIVDNIEELKPNQIQFTRGAGTPLYMAPEQWKGEQLGVFTDVYAFSCMLYEILSGQPVTEGKTFAELRDSHCGGRLRSTPLNLPKDVVTLLSKGLVFKPTHRYDKWDGVIDAIERAYSIYSGLSAPKHIVSLSPSREERRDVGASYNAIGLAYQDLGKAALAVDSFEKALTRARELGDRRGESVALGNLGNGYTALGSVRQAIRYFEETLVLDREFHNPHAEANTLSNLGNAYRSLGDAQQVIRYCEQSLAIAQEISNKRVEANALNNLATGYEMLGDIRRAIDYFEQVLTIDRATQNHRGEAASLGNLGIAYFRLGELRQAIGYFEQCLSLHQEIGDRHGEGMAVGNLGIMYLQLGEVQRAIGCYEQSLAIACEIGDRHGEGQALGNLGRAYSILGNERMALGYYKQSLVIAHEIGDRHSEGITLGNLGSVYLNLGDTRQAIIYLEQALTIDREVGNVDGVAGHSLNMARLHVHQGETDRALTLAQEAAHLWSQIGSINAQVALQLVTQLKGGAAAARAEADLKQAAFEAFQRASNLQVMQAAVGQYPFMKEVGFIQVVELAVSRLVPSKHKSVLEQHLIWLKQLATKK